MDESSLRLDGNACAGLLREIFTEDVTAASAACASCGAVAQLGGQHLYGYPDGPGAVLRCGPGGRSSPPGRSRPGPAAPAGSRAPGRRATAAATAGRGTAPTARHAHRHARRPGTAP